uniref:ATP synthase CFO B' subunit subunit II n=1 Tax=Dixoniella grisea TaxID=35153 RepID=UPI001FCDBDA6|nr:ATP synthase CFO B' subunit subunit II [Dixoniella grisea]UNJ17097.1 ATP synthase CFO B' subunit subunit II [Dixoniella grisea]
MYCIEFVSLPSSFVSAEGGLFNFDATLPLMAIQVLVLMLILNTIFFKPILAVLDQRDEYIVNLATASRQLAQAEELANSYQTKLAEARQEAQVLVSNAKTEAQNSIAQEIKEAQNKAEKLLLETSKQLNIQQEQALATLEKQIDILVEQISGKILAFEK